MAAPPTLLITAADEDPVDRVRVGPLLGVAASLGWGLNRVAAHGSEPRAVRAASAVLVPVSAPSLPTLASLRALTEVPIAVSSDVDDDAAEVEMLETGADLVLPPGLEPSLGLARFRRLLVGAAARPNRVPTVDAGLTELEARVLHYLMEREDQVVSRAEMYLSIHGTDYDGFDRSLDVHVSRIRRKLHRSGGAPIQIRSVRGVGYTLSVRARPAHLQTTRQVQDRGQRRLVAAAHEVDEPNHC